MTFSKVLSVLAREAFHFTAQRKMLRLRSVERKKFYRLNWVLQLLVNTMLSIYR